MLPGIVVVLRDDAMVLLENNCMNSVGYFIFQCE